MSVVSREEQTQKAFDAQDKQWGAPRFFALGFMTLAICLTTIYLMSAVTGCSLQIVP
ncbi:MAG TPA: hypothetical protein VGG39_27800 [Polyangiaceae bacterium]|jgi:hypothetical protein